MNFREIILFEMESRGISCAELSRISGVNQSNLSRFLKGDKRMVDTNIDKLITALDLSIVKIYR